MIDGFGRKIDYLRLSVTDLCNVRCRYCMPEKGIEKCNHDKFMSFEEIDSLVGKLITMGIKKIRITGGEPLVKNGIVDLVRKIKQYEGLEELVMTTNGILLEEMAYDLKSAGLDRVNISLDTLNSNKYKYMTRGGDLEKVMRGILAAEKVGLGPIKLNCVLVGGFNDDEIGDFVKMTKFKKIDVRFIELMPMGEVALWHEDKLVKSEEVIKRIPSLHPIERIDPHSPAAYYKLPDGLGKVGLIQPMTCKFCSDCNRIRLTSEGKLRYCLHSDDELDLMNILKEGGELENSIKNYLQRKPKEHGLENRNYIKRNMVSIGG